ncbi:MAG: hypothetical protein ACOCPM_00895 [Bacteroidales bacterium]
MDDILILLLGILWAAFSFYQSKEKKKKKAEEARRVSQASSSGDGSYEDEGDIREQAKSKGLLDTIFESLEERDQGSESPYTNQEDFLSDEEINHKKEEAKAEQENLAEEQRTEEKKQKQISNNRHYYRTRKDKKQKMVRNIVRDFDGKKAVIYTEILNRPHQ